MSRPATGLGDAARAAPQFAIEDEFQGVTNYERGHIHDTFVATFRKGRRDFARFLLQRMNERVFTDIPGLMHNVAQVTRHLQTKAHGSDQFEPLTLVRTWSGASYLAEANGSWRTYHYLEGTESFDHCRDGDQAYQASSAFGTFQNWLLDLDAHKLRETIPHFFSSPHRLEQLQDAIEQDPLGRVRAAQLEIDFVTERIGMIPVFETLMRDGRIPPRVVHGDTKLNNVLFDTKTGRARAICDLDTCMPGYSLYDFGDLVRFTAATSNEDETDLTQAGLDIMLYRSLVAGYLDTTQDFLLPVEREHMPFAARLVTLTIGIRFLADFLAGDVYFKTNPERPAHNLERARVQFAMVADMERKREDMEAAVV